MELCERLKTIPVEFEFTPPDQEAVTIYCYSRLVYMPQLTALFRFINRATSVRNGEETF